MHLYRSSRIIITFGTKKEQFVPANYYASMSPGALLQAAPFNSFASSLQTNHLWLLHQVHSTVGHRVPLATEQRPFKYEGDFLYTNLPGHAAGVATADCVPLIFYDTKNHALAVVHAGWRGAVAGIVFNTLASLKHTFGTHPRDLEIFIGPSAKACCYKVDTAVTQAVHPGWRSALTPLSSTEFFFDLPLLLTLQLQEKGVSSIDTTYSVCTICTPSYCSFRRDKTSYRQLTAAILL
jgi:YfiH family protein